MKLRKFTKRRSATGKGYPQCQHVEAGKQCEKPIYADGLCWGHQASDPLRVRDCADQDCGRFYDANARRMQCRAMSDNACARPTAQSR